MSPLAQMDMPLGMDAMKQIVGIIIVALIVCGVLRLLGFGRDGGK